MQGKKDTHGEIGDYIYDKFLGQGSYGTVYKGYNKKTN